VNVDVKILVLTPRMVYYTKVARTHLQCKNCVVELAETY